MGNKLKSNRKKLYSERANKILALHQAQNKISTIQKCESEKNIQCQQDYQQSKSILSDSEVTDDLEFIKNETISEVIENYYQYNNSLQNVNQNDSINSNVDVQEKQVLANLLCQNLDKYYQQIKEYLQMYNLEVKIAQNSHQEWVNFCEELKKNKSFHQMNKKKHDYQDNNQIKTSFYTTPQYKNNQRSNRQQLSNINKFFSSASNLDDNYLNDKDSFQPCLKRNIASDYNKQDDQSNIRGKTYSTSIGSFLGEKNLFQFNQQGQNGKLSIYQTHYYNSFPVDDEEFQLKKDLKKFKHYMKESNEMYLLFQKISTAFQHAFFTIYGKENEKIHKQYLTETTLLESRLEIEIRFIVRVFEKLIDRIMQNFIDQQEESNSEQSSPLRKRTFMQNMGSKAFPVVNMLLNFNHKVFERIRQIMQKVYSSQTKQLFTNMEIYLKNDVKQFGDLSNNYKDSIEGYKQLIPIFQKNMVEGIKILQTTLKQIIMEEKRKTQIQSLQQKNLYQNSYLQSTSLVSPQSLAEKSLQLQASVFSLGKNNDEINENDHLTCKLSYQIKHPIEEEDEFCLSTDSNAKKVKKNFVKQFEQEEKSEEKENSSDQNQDQENDQNLNQQKVYGIEDLLPTYEYVICQAESQLKTTLLFDLKLFLLVFNNLYDRLPQYSGSISNATNFMSAYQSILKLQEKTTI